MCLSIRQVCVCMCPSARCVSISQVCACVCPPARCVYVCVHQPGVCIQQPGVCMCVSTSQVCVCPTASCVCPSARCVCPSTRCMYVRVCVGVVGADECIPLTTLVDVCLCCRLLMFVCLPLFETLSLSLNLVNKEAD